MNLSPREEACLRFIVTRGEAVKPLQLVFLPNPEIDSPLPSNLIAAKKTLYDLHRKGLLRKVGRSQIAYEAVAEAKALV